MACRQSVLRSARCADMCALTRRSGRRSVFAFGARKLSADRQICARHGASDRSGYGALVGILKRVAPIFPVRDLRASLAHYEQLGFATREYDGGDYGYAICDGVEIHLGVVPDTLPTTKHSAYLWVDHADALAQAWRAAGVEIHGPEDTEWGQHEGAHVDPDGNVLRFGSPVERANADESSS